MSSSYVYKIYIAVIDFVHNMLLACIVVHSVSETAKHLVEFTALGKSTMVTT